MMKINSIIIRVFIIAIFSFLFYCQQPGLENGSPTPKSPHPGNSGEISFSGNTATSISVAWTIANDDVTPQNSLLYKVYYSPSNNIATVVQVEANGKPIGDWSANISSIQASGLTSCNTYYFNVLVKNTNGGKAAYVPGSSATLFIVDDFEDGDLYNYISPGTVNGLWSAEVSIGTAHYTDTAFLTINNGTTGNSTKSLQLDTQIVADTVEYWNYPDGQYDGLYLIWAITMGPIHANGLTGISFKAKAVNTVVFGPHPNYGDYVEGYSVNVQYLDPNNSSNNKYSTCLIPPITTSWQTYNVPFSSFTDGDSVSEILPALGVISIYYFVAALDPFSAMCSICIDDVKFY